MAPEVLVQLIISAAGLCIAGVGYAIIVFTDPKRRKSPETAAAIGDLFDTRHHRV